jgi:hypothetical protein
MPMNDLAREKLVKLVFIHNDTILGDARRCEALLRESCPDWRREVAALVAAHDAGVVRRLIETTGQPLTPAMTVEMARTLQADSPITDEAAFWAVRAWAAALGRIDRNASSWSAPPAQVATGNRGRSRPRRFFRSLVWSLIAGPFYAVGLLLFGWAFLPAVFLLLGALIDLGLGSFSSEAQGRVQEALSMLWQACQSGEAKDRDALLAEPAKRGLVLWVGSIGTALSVLLFTPALAWRAIWSGPSRSVGGTLVLLPYLAGLGAGLGAAAGALFVGSNATESGAAIGAGLLGLAGLLAGVIGWGSALVKASGR